MDRAPPLAGAPGHEPGAGDLEPATGAGQEASAAAVAASTGSGSARPAGTGAAGVRSRAMRLGAVRGPVPGREWKFLEAAGAAAGRAVRVAVNWARRHPLESAAVVLLGLGGLIYPPVWLMGVIVAVFSKVWSIRDKWIGLVLPVFLVIVGIVVEVSQDGTHRHWTTYVRDAWMFAGHLSRILALLGAIYLAWRAEHGPHTPGPPPWQRGGRLG